MNINKDAIEKIFSISYSDKNISPVCILIQPSPDPDCLGAAAGWAVLMKDAFDLESEIYHYGEVSHPQNKSMKNVLRIPLNEGEEFNHNNAFRTVVLDTDLHNSGFKCDDLQKVDVRIDHHSMDRDDEPTHKDVRSVGSTCAMVWEYLEAFNVDLSKYSDAATALILGIKTDTLDFTSVTTSELDMEAYRALLPYADKQALAKVTNFPLPKEVFELEAKAYSARSERNTTLVSFVGVLSPHSRDSISTIADRFSRMAGITTVVIMAVIDSHLQASVRSDDSRVDVHDLCIKVFGKKYAGAKEGSGGAKLPILKQLEYITDKEIRDLVISQIVKTFENKVFTTLGEKDELQVDQS